MNLLRRLSEALLRNQQDSIIFEITQRCNHECVFCYNAWKDPVDYPKGELDTEKTKKLIGMIVEQSRCRLVTFTGGEPLLRKDLPELVTFARGLGVGVNIISNGRLMDEETAKDLIKRDVSIFELPLLSADRKVHNKLCGADSFDKVVDAVASIKLHKGRVVVVFVGMKGNIDGFQEMIELSVAIGADGIMFNRCNIGGEGTRHIDEILPSVEQVRRALDVADAAVAKYKIGISCSIPVQPCLVDTSPYKNLSFGFCAAGTKRSYYTVDPVGNVRMCNHTPSILGNIFESSFGALTRKKNIEPFVKCVPKFCAGCKLERTCLGGCKAAAEAAYGSASAEEPFLKCNISLAKPLRP
jgi:radical SAM protein with 4Fe4S-binding SPASM domain